MDGIKSFLFDTYALYEIVHENPNYKPYTKGISIVVTKLNLMELHYILLRTYGKEYAEKAYNYFKEFEVEIEDDTIKEANEFKLKYKARKLSYTDCIGYTLAKKLNAKFLTGDKEFQDQDNVEFVK